MAKMGRPPKITGEQRAVLVGIVQSAPMSTTEELRAAFERETGLKVHGQTLEKHLRTAGIERRLHGSGVKVEVATGSKARYSYTHAHRRLAPEQRYPSCLTDREWALVEDVFGNEGCRGTPPQYPRRLLVDACCYVVRTGGSWRMLPNEFQRVSAVAERVSHVSALVRARQVRADARPVTCTVAGTRRP